MKVLFVTGALGGGGAERVIVNLINTFENKGINTAAITVFSNKTTYQIDKRATIIHLKNNIKLPVFNRINSIIQIIRIIKQQKPDVVISFVDQVNILTSVSFLFIKNKIKLILSERNDPYVEPNSPRQRKIRDWAYMKADGVVYQTIGEKEYFNTIVSPRVPQIIIENPLKPNLPSYQPDKITNVFIAAGRLYHQKNYKMMIDAFEMVVKSGRIGYKLKIYGQGDLQDELTQYISVKKLDDYISLEGFSEDIHSVMATSAGYLLSSDYEGISNSMAEALAIGVPVVTTDYPSGGARMYVEDGVSGYLVKCGDTEGFANAICSIIDCKEKSINMGKTASERMRKLKASDIAQKWEEFIMSVIK